MNKERFDQFFRDAQGTFNKAFYDIYHAFQSILKDRDAIIQKNEIEMICLKSDNDEMHNKIKFISEQKDFLQKENQGLKMSLKEMDEGALTILKDISKKNKSIPKKEKLPVKKKSIK